MWSQVLCSLRADGAPSGQEAAYSGFLEEEREGVPNTSPGLAQPWGMHAPLIASP